MQTKMEIKSNTIQNTMVITCTQKAQIMSNSIQNIMVISNHLHVEEGEDQVNPEHHDDHFQGGEGEDQIQLPPEKHVDHLHAE